MNSTPITSLDLSLQIKNWGWMHQTEKLSALARDALLCKNVRIENVVAHVCDMEISKVDHLLEGRPHHIKAIEWLAQKRPEIRPFIEKVLCLSRGLPYYEAPFDYFTASGQPVQQDLNKRCAEVDCILLNQEDGSICLIFSSYASLVKFETMGRAESAKDPIRIFGREANRSINLAVGRSDEVYSILNGASGDVHISGNLDAIWSIGSNANNEERIIGRIIDHALSNKATDISIIPMRDGQGCKIMMRKYGEMIDVPAIKRLTSEESKFIVNILLAKSSANPSGSKVREPKDGQITYRSGSGDAFLRLSFIPLNHPGVQDDLISTSIRIFLRTESKIDLASLKVHEEVMRAVSTSTKFSQGLILVAGPTNTGKSTLVAGAIGQHQAHFQDRRKRISIENPIERFIPGVIQINVPEYIENGFEQMLRSIKRHDPDMIWVGEIRDRETAEICVSSASSGHLVFSTIHANDSIVAYDVLSKSVHADKRYQLIESLSLIISQRLIRQVCPSCSVKGRPTEEEVSAFEAYINLNDIQKSVPSQVVHCNQNGCKDCADGYVGVLPINEVLPVSRTVKSYMHEANSGANRRSEIAKQRTLTLFDSAYNLVSNGLSELDAIFI